MKHQLSDLTNVLRRSVEIAAKSGTTLFWRKERYVDNTNPITVPLVNIKIGVATVNSLSQPSVNCFKSKPCCQQGPSLPFIIARGETAKIKA